MTEATVVWYVCIQQVGFFVQSFYIFIMEHKIYRDIIEYQLYTRYMTYNLIWYVDMYFHMILAMESLRSVPFTPWVCNITIVFCQAFEQEHDNLGETWGLQPGGVGPTIWKNP